VPLINDPAIAALPRRFEELVGKHGI